MWAFAVAVSLLFSTHLAGQGKTSDTALAVERGANSYRVHCAVCHGKTGTGDGPLADQLHFSPPDLTRLLVRNKGKFDAELIGRIIDGRRPVKGHGGPEMPVWGDAFLDSREGYSREAVREKIAQIAEYLQTLQKR
jgi:mono/diheme cytochrome c family protein